MASKPLSPAGKLLRHSRLFSLPPPLPKGTNQRTDQNGNVFNSDTATSPYPDTQAIQTTPEGLHRGEWGLKRPLPLRQTQSTSTPVFRIREIDSIDHVTDYESAADHYLTVKKWQEMGVPINMGGSEDNYIRNTSKVSAFEDSYHDSDKGIESRVRSTRWKYKGPDINKISSLEFERYVKTQVRKQKDEFNIFARRKLNERRAARMKQDSFDKGEEARPYVQLTDDEFEQEMKRIRTTSATTELWTYIWEFLDLPGSAPLESSGPNFADAVDHWTAPVEETPKVHPSGGLGYLRTANVIHNHPVLGPMRFAPPVEARILSHGRPTSGSRQQGTHILGVGGFVAMERGFPMYNVDPEDPYANQEARFEHAVEGGAKTWLAPRSATIDASGRIKLEVGKANADAVAVWEHRVDKRPTRVADSLGSLPSYSSSMTLEARNKKKLGFKRTLFN